MATTNSAPAKVGSSSVCSAPPCAAPRTPPEKVGPTSPARTPPKIRPSKPARDKFAGHNDNASAEHSHPAAGAAIRRTDQTAATSYAALLCRWLECHASSRSEEHTSELQ